MYIIIQQMRLYYWAISTGNYLRQKSLKYYDISIITLVRYLWQFLSYFHIKTNLVAVLISLDLLYTVAKQNKKKKSSDTKGDNSCSAWFNENGHLYQWFIIKSIIKFEAKIICWYLLKY